jgi:murein hydrolase activator
MIHVRIIIVLWFSCFFIGHALADSQQSELDHILKKMADIKMNLQKKYDKKTELQDELKKIEIEFSQTARQHEALQQQIFKQRLNIAALQNESDIRLDELTRSKQILAKQLQIAYLLKSQNPLKFLFMQKNLSQINRTLYYYQYFNHSYSQSIQHLQKTLSDIHTRQHQLTIQYQNLQLLQHQQQMMEDKLTNMKTSRTQLVNEIDQTIQNQNQTLQKLITQLKPVTWPAGNGNFASLKGHLPWPTQGKVLHFFNTPIENSEINWSGELIEAPENQPVYAVANGVVVFAKWLEGYGLLLIVNHGNGYMTLYGRNHSLYKHEGEPVRAGEMISSVGESGGFSQPSLYFGIRYDAQALDPNQWCF